MTVKRSEMVEPYVGKDGRQKVYLFDKNGIGREEDLANIVARTFVDICGQPIEGKLPSFKDGNTKNCRADNLYWV